MKKKHLLLLSVLSGLLFAAAWPLNGFAPLLLVAFIPLLYIEDHISRKRPDFHRFSVMLYVFPGFFFWNLLTTYWIWNSTPAGAVGAVLFNSFLMSLAFSIYHWTKKNIYSPHAAYGLVFIWTSYELLIHRWDLNWPWLSLGNGFSEYYSWIQWYEFTGIFGGTFWVIISNILLFKLLKAVFGPERKNITALAVGAATAVFLPLIISLFMFYNYEEKTHPVDITVVQPNLDPYKEQYVIPPLRVIDRNLGLAVQKLDSTTQFIVSPESAIQEDIWERELDYSPSLSKLKEFVEQHPHVSVIIGASTFKRFLPGEAISSTARKFKNFDGYYDAFNTAFLIDSAGISQWTHKSKLTPGVERMPYPQYFKFLESLALDLGGTIGSLGTDRERKVFTTIYDSLRVAAAICYESVYGEFVNGFIRKGANLLFIVTNDGWWGDTPGHRQHFSYARLRAIETRRSIARSANTGISAFINQRGEVIQQTDYWVRAVISDQLNANWGQTFYVKYGDYLGRISAFISAILVLVAVSMRMMRRRSGR